MELTLIIFSHGILGSRGNYMDNYELVDYILKQDDDWTDEDQNEYFSTVERIVKNRNIPDILIILDEKKEQIYANNILSIIEFLDEALEEGYSDFVDIRNYVLKIMYSSYNCDMSRPYQYVRLLMKLKMTLQEIFKYIVDNTDENNVDKVCISVFALYSPIKLTEMSSELVNAFLDKVYHCFTKNKENHNLIAGIKNFLMKKISSNEYIYYYDKFVKAGIVPKE